MQQWFRLMRVSHYIKNLLLFFPLFFVGNIHNWDQLSRVIIAFISFSLAASSIYILNENVSISEFCKNNGIKNYN